MQITKQHKKSFIRVLCSQDDHVMEDTLKNGFEEENSFGGDTLVWVFYFLKKEGRPYISFLKDFSYMLEIHLENISKT
jgi:hypothetical protein